tara:strand:- start:6360 stop:7541 length:1182 start_codon:yes stop_codon:yes gene_type:complete
MRFSVVGISHWESEVSIRELFYLDKDRKKRLKKYTKQVPSGVLALETCNRTEIFGFCEPKILVKALCSSVNIEHSLFEKHGYVLSDNKAIRHIYRVGLGLDSQILGDSQIIQQLKRAYNESKNEQLSGEFHQLIQSIFKAHKRSRTETDFGRGNASVGFEVTQRALEHFKNLEDIKILLIGAGKMGKVSCKNLISNGAKNISVINRSFDRAKNLANSLDIEISSFSKLEYEINNADLIITATGAPEPILIPEQFTNIQMDKLIIDLSVPRNVAHEVIEIDGITLIDMDSISKVNQKALEKRKKAIPILENIIQEEIKAYKSNIDRSRFLLPHIKEVNRKLDSITEEELQKVRNKLDPEIFNQLEKITDRVKKKILAIHIDRLDQEYQKVEQDA